MIDWFVSTAVAVSILILVVLVLRGLVARHFGARAAFALWLAPLLRVILPPLVEWTGGASSGSGAAGVSALPELIIVHVPAASSQGTIMPWLVGLWAGGAMLYLGVQLVRHHRFIGRALARGIRLAPRGVPYDVIASDAVEGPLATGLVHPLILVPADFSERFTPEQQRLALLHEQLHHRRGDLWASAAALVVVAALWFNPFAHLALGAFRRDMESACDTSVIALSNPGEAASYAETILRSAVRPVPRSLCALTSLDELKGRLTMLTLNHHRGRRFAGVLLAAGFSAAGLSVSVPAVASDQTRTEIIERKIITKGDHGEQDVTKSLELGELEKGANRCDGEKVEITADGGSAGKKNAIKLLICGDKGQGAKGLADALASAAANIDRDNRDLDPAIKADLKAKIDAKIRELRARG
ncbi:MAG: M56 family metallopeptidase [Sphingomicrobium sp.]